MLSSAYASNIGNPYIGFQIGQSTGYLSKHNPQITYYNNLLTDAYPLKNKNDATLLLGIEAGYAFSGHGLLPSIALGLGYYGMPHHYSYNGYVIETPKGGASSTLYTYRYRIATKRLMGQVKLSWALPYHLDPFIDIGVGSAWIQLSHYREQANSSSSYVALSPFQSNTKNNLTYQAGLGIGYRFNFKKHAKEFDYNLISLGYRYVDYGKVNFGIRNSSYPYALKPGTLTAQEFYLNFTHFF